MASISVTPASVVEEEEEVVGRVVGGVVGVDVVVVVGSKLVVDVDVTGTVALPIGVVLLPGIIGVVVIGVVVKDVVVLVPGSTVVMGGKSVVVVPPVSMAVVVEFVIGVSRSVEVSGGTSVVGVVVGTAPVVEIPVPGPVMPSGVDEVAVAVTVAFCDGSIMLEISLIMELIGSTGSDVLVVVVTMPVGAKRISDVLVVGSGVSSAIGELLGVRVGVSSAVVVVVDSVVGGTSASVLVLVVVDSVVGATSASVPVLVVVVVDSSSLGVGVVSAPVPVLVLVVVVVDSSSLGVGVVSAAVPVPVVVVGSSSVASGLLDEELLDKLEEVVSDVPLVGEGESGVGAGSGGETTIVLEIIIVVTFESLDGSRSGSDCLLVVSVDGGLGDTVSDDVIVPLLNWRLTWRGK